MGFLDWLRKPKPTITLSQLCYDVAYFVLPHYVFNNFDKLIELCLDTPTAAGPYFYVMAARMREIEPDIEDAKLLRWHRGQIGEGQEYFALEFPTPPPVDMSNVSIEQLVAGDTNVVLAPHFAVVIRKADEVQYFILGQAPIGGGTTLRSITPPGINSNHGPGPQPTLAAFLNAVQERITHKLL